ncbi:class I SAM-dependent methyltransferase [Eionea flava]
MTTKHAPTKDDACNTSSLASAHSMNKSLEKNYNCYFSTGYYRARYPRVNQHTLSIVTQAMSGLTSHEPLAIKKILDYGCGEGRYILHCLSAYPNAHISAYDISSAPLKKLATSLASNGQDSRVSLIHGQQALDQYISGTKNGTYSLALLLFGVLSHVSTAHERQSLLAFLRQQLDQEHGRLVLSVPNKARRFRALQRNTQRCDISYSRTINQQTVTFTYHLYSVKSITAELAEAGLDIVSIQAESVLPESWITKHPIVGWLDKCISRMIPPSWGYGILVSARPTAIAHRNAKKL